MSLTKLAEQSERYKYLLKASLSEDILSPLLPLEKLTVTAAVSLTA